MHCQIQPLLRDFSGNLIPNTISGTYDAQERADRDMFVNQSLSLVSREFLRIFWITLEVSALQEIPVNFIQISEVVVEIRPMEIRMLIGKKIRQSELNNFT